MKTTIAAKKPQPDCPTCHGTGNNIFDQKCPCTLHVGRKARKMAMNGKRKQYLRAGKIVKKIQAEARLEKQVKKEIRRLQSKHNKKIKDDDDE